MRTHGGKGHVAKGHVRRPVLEPLEGRVLMSLPPGFAQSTFASGLTSPTSMAFAPDGRLFVTEQGGALKVVGADGRVRSTFASVPARNQDEQGLLNVTFDPDYANNRYVYAHWITTNRNNRVTRFTADPSNPDVALAGSAVHVIDLPSNAGGNHQGGAIGFGADGKLYLAVGDHGDTSLAQSLNNPFGKVLRFNPDGTIPADNPFVGSTTGINQSIWARGLRNPFTMSFQPGTGKLYINDVGSTMYEEINQGAAGANYGWPTTEGLFSAASHPSFTNPLYAYRRGEVGCAIAGGAFYNPPAGAANPFPAEYHGKYLFGDYCENFIRVLNPADNSVGVFATPGQLPAEAVDLDVGPDGSVYAVGRSGTVVKISYTGSSAPVISSHPQARTVTAGQGVTFSVAASGGAPLSYQWQRNGANIAGATSASYTLASAAASDNGAAFRCVVTNAAGTATSNAATLTVTANRSPVATITSPAAGSNYAGGQTIAYAGSATDPEDGSLPSSRFTWWVDFHHDTHFHPFIAPRTGASSGGFAVPTVGETSENVWYRVHLSVTDSGGMAHATYRDVHPRTSNVTLLTSPSELGVELDGRPAASPVSFVGVEGIMRQIAAPATQTVDGVTYEFVRWSDDGDRDHTINTPADDTTYTAVYRAVDATAPTASASAPDVTAVDSNVHDFAVAYADDNAVDITSLGTGDLRVTGPNGYDQVASLIDVDASGASAVATYRITPPGAFWEPGDNGAYAVTLDPRQVFDAAGNAVPPGVIGTFSVNVPAPQVWHQTSAADFAAGVAEFRAAVHPTGEIKLNRIVADGFGRKVLGPYWATKPWSEGAKVALDGVDMAVSGAQVVSVPTFPAVAIQGQMDFPAAAGSRFGIAEDLADPQGSWALFSTEGTGDTLFASVASAGSVTTVAIGPLPAGSHRYDIIPSAGKVTFSIDGVHRATVAAGPLEGANFRAVVSAEQTERPLIADAVSVKAYHPRGQFTSSIFDAGGVASWRKARWTADLPAGTEILVETISGDTPTPDASWSTWSAVSAAGDVTSADRRYLRYRVTLITSDQVVTPNLRDVSIEWYGK